MSLLRPTSHMLPLIGWKEDIGLPELGLGKLIAKIDTGARTAALHAENISIMGRRVAFTMELGGKKRNCIARLSELKRVKSGRLYLVPVSEDTRGHGTTGMASFWKQQLQELLQSAPRRSPG